MILIIPIGCQGLGKSTLSKNLKERFNNFYSISQHDYSSEKEFLGGIGDMSTKELNILYIDRCNIREKNREDIFASLICVPEKVIIVDFISDNDTDVLKSIAFRRARDRPQENQSIKYNPKNNGAALKKVINKKIDQYETPSDNYCDIDTLIINVDVMANPMDIIRNIEKYVSSENN